MSDTQSVSTTTRWKPLDAHQRRVLGVLIEKAKTTPAGYPMSVNAIVAGCNQKNNRQPITAYDDFDVEKALSELQELGVVKEIDWVGRVPKYKHLAYEWLGVKPAELAVMAELLLRGAQAIGDLRGRAARMEPIADLGALKPIVDGLVERHLMVELTAPGRGQIVSHNLYSPGELAELRKQLGSGHEPERAMPRTVPQASREVKIIDLASIQSPSGDAATFQGFEHGANVSCFVVTFAQGKGARRHRHAYEETFVVLAGEIRLVADGTSRTVGSGRIVVIPAGTWHEFQVTSESPVQMVNIHPVPRMATEWAD